MAKTIQSSFSPSPKFDKVTESFDKLNNTDLFLKNTWALYSTQMQQRYTRFTGYLNARLTGHPIREELGPVIMPKLGFFNYGPILTT